MRGQPEPLPGERRQVSLSEARMGTEFELGDILVASRYCVDGSLRRHSSWITGKHVEVTVVAVPQDDDHVIDVVRRVEHFACRRVPPPGRRGARCCLVDLEYSLQELIRNVRVLRLDCAHRRFAENSHG